MASNSSELLEYLNEHILECVICKESLKHPKALPCLHVFCRDCIGTYITKNAKNGRYACPTCRENHALPKDGAHSLRDAFLQNSLMEVSNLMQKKAVPCTSCNSGKEAKSACPTCSDFLCSDCKQSHEKLRSTRNHELTPIEQLGDAKVLAKFQKNRYDMCRVHATEVCKLYCQDDDSDICTICTFDPMHKSHNIITMEAKLQELQIEARKTTTKLDDHVKTLKRQKQLLTDKCTDIKQQEKRALQQISERETEINQMLQRFLSTLKDEVKQKSQNYQHTAHVQLQQVETELQEKRKKYRLFAFLDSLPVPSALRVASDIIKTGAKSFGQRNEETIQNEFQDIKLEMSRPDDGQVESMFKSMVGFLSQSRSALDMQQPRAANDPSERQIADRIIVQLKKYRGGVYAHELATAAKISYEQLLMVARKYDEEFNIRTGIVGKTIISIKRS